MPVSIETTAFLLGKVLTELSLFGITFGILPLLQLASCLLLEVLREVSPY
jgi:hypothetical protein